MPFIQCFVLLHVQGVNSIRISYLLHLSLPWPSSTSSSNKGQQQPSKSSPQPILRLPPTKPMALNTAAIIQARLTLSQLIAARSITDAVSSLSATVVSMSPSIMMMPTSPDIHHRTRRAGRHGYVSKVVVGTYQVLGKRQVLGPLQRLDPLVYRVLAAVAAFASCSF